MFDDLEQDKRLSLAKPLTVCAVGMGIGFGICGVGLMIGHDRVTPVVATVGSVIFFSSFLGLIVIGCMALIRLVIDYFQA